MAYRLDANYGYGTGADGNYSADAESIVNNYAKVYYLAGNTIKISNVKSTGIATNSFSKVGQEILLHVAGVATNFTKTECNKRGWWTLAKITAIADTDGTLTLSKNVSELISGFSIGELLVQAITIPNFKTVTIDGYKTITCPQFDGDIGGVVAFKCSEELKFNHEQITGAAPQWQYGGTINVLDKGMPSGDYWKYGWIKGENEGEVTHDFEGHHNYRTTRHLTINYPDGAVWLCTKKLTCDQYASIGDGSEDIMNTQDRGVIWEMDGDIFGGATIFIAAGEIENSDAFASMINKRPHISYNNGARGLSRVYVASETILKTTQLFAYDRISDPERMSKVFNITSFGNGNLGDVKNVTKQLNSYALVTGISSNQKQLTLGNIDENGVAKFAAGALIMIHAAQKDATNLDRVGKFMVTTIVSRSADKITLTDPYDLNTYAKHDAYNVQVIAIPQYKNFTMTEGKKNTNTPTYANGIGGILALAVSETCDLSGAILSVRTRGGAFPYGAEGLKQINCGAMAEKLPLGEGHGSIFILAQNLIMNSATRLGAENQRLGSSDVDFGAGGRYFGGINRSITNYNNHSDARHYPFQTAYNDTNTTAIDTVKGHVPKFANTKTSGTKDKRQGGAGYALSGGRGGVMNSSVYDGGYGSNSPKGARQGAHILIIADQITGFCLDAIGTGGDGGRIFSDDTMNNSVKYLRTGEQGGAGYGGSGGSISDDYRGGNGGQVGGGGGTYDGKNWASGGGSGGFCFVYCNKVVNQANAGIGRD